MSHKKIIIAYFSKKGRNYVDGQIIDLPIGNTQVVATIIQDITHGELFQIEPVSPYPDDYTQATDVARDELRGGARPPLARLVSDIADYAVVFLGYPNWWNTMPMPVFTFLEKHDLAGKIIAPFCTHEGTGLGNSVKDIVKFCPKSRVVDGLSILGSKVKNSKNDIENWLAKISL